MNRLSPQTACGLRLELGITNLRQGQTLASDLAKCRSRNGMSAQEVKAYSTKWSEIEFEEKVAYRKNCYTRNSNFTLLDCTVARRSITARPGTVPSEPFAVARRTNSAGDVQTSRFRDRSTRIAPTRIGSTVSFSFTPSPKKDCLP